LAVRVYQQFATLDLLSGGRAEIMAGRGSFIESFPLFGLNLDDYDALSAEKLDLLLAIRANARPVWQGEHRAPLNGEGVYPRALQDPLPVWIASGGTPQSVARAGALGLPLAIAIIGGEPARFAPLAALYREAGRRAGIAPEQLELGINGHGFLADTAEAAVEAFFAPYAEVMSRVGRERGWPPLTRAQFDIGRGPRGHLTVGTPDESIAKILGQYEVFGHQRYLMQMAVGAPAATCDPALDRASGHGRQACGERSPREAQGSGIGSRRTGRRVNLWPRQSSRADCNCGFCRPRKTQGEVSTRSR
jgi:alkanesulfonate monooxygenase SsuD/methylene tetrahydromethanopterin reductase-like flavin-dependent oxidoreductase (luciferase family)